MDRWIRWTVALVVFGLVFGASLVVAGTAQEPPSPEDSPAWFGTAPSQPGDRGLYKTALVVVKDGSGEYFDMNARYAFERLDDRLVPVDGALVPVASFVGEWRSEPFRLPLRDVLEIPVLPQLQFPDCWPRGGFDPMDEESVEAWEEAMEACEDAYDDTAEAYEDAMEEWGDAFEEHMEQWESALDREFHRVEATGWHVTHHALDNETLALSYREDTSFPHAVGVQGIGFTGGVEVEEVAARLVMTEPVPVPGPCGWRTSLQAGDQADGGPQALQDMWQPIWVHGECPADMELGFAEVRHEPGPIEMRVSGRDRIHGQEAVVFSMPEDPDRLRLWFTEDQPYPLRILTRTESVPAPVREALGRDYEAPTFYVLHELIEFEAGQSATAPNPIAFPDMTGSRGPAGPALGGFAHPWPVGDALADAADPTKAPESCRTWREWTMAHPAFTIRSARFVSAQTPDPDHADPVVDEAWTLVAADSTGGRAVVVQRHTETVFDVPGLAHAGPLVRETGSASQPIRATSYACQQLPLPTGAPTAASGRMPTVEAAATVLAAWTGTQATDYAFADCASCGAAVGRLSVGVSPSSPGGGDRIDWLTLAEDGQFQAHLASGDPYPEPRFSDPAWDPEAGRDPWGFHVASSGVWHMPQPATAATLAAAGAAAGGLFLLWPALKAALAALPMFSRIRDEDLLEHPVRNQIHQLVSEQPGIHFQEMVRRAGKGRGTMEHHLRKLVSGGILVEKAERGFSCYFPKGRIDRHLMVAAPLLKAEGARQVIRAVAAQPGTAALDIAQKLGISTSTVNYHVKKLADAGLLGTRREGRFVRLDLTSLGEQALGEFGGT